MGMIGNYVMVDEEQLQDMLELDSDDLADFINELEEDECSEVYCIDKLWDGLHFLFTGVSADSPIENNKLSEAVVCVYIFDVDGDEGFAGYTNSDELADIIAALEAFDIITACENARLSDFSKNEIYPNIWHESEKISLMEELTAEYTNLLGFYKRAFAKQKNIIFSVF